MASLQQLKNPILTYLKRNTHDNPIKIQLDFGLVPGDADINNVIISLLAQSNIVKIQNVQVIPSTLRSTTTIIGDNQVDITIPHLNQQLYVQCDIISPLPVSSETNIDMPILEVDSSFRIGNGRLMLYTTFLNIEVEKPLIITSFTTNITSVIVHGCTATLNKVIVLYTMNYENRGRYPLTATLQFTANANPTGNPSIIFDIIPGQTGWTGANNSATITFPIAGTPNFNNPIRGSQQIMTIVRAIPNFCPGENYSDTINQSAILQGVYSNKFTTRASTTSTLTTITIEYIYESSRLHNYVANKSFEYIYAQFNK